MTISSLKAAVASALSDHRIDQKEAKKLVAAAGTKISSSEVKVLGALADSLKPSGPGTSAAPYGTAGARDLFNGVFQRLDVPYGANRNPVVQKLKAFFETQPLGPPLARAPSTVALIEVVLRDSRTFDGTRQTAFLEAGTGKTYLRNDGAGRGQLPEAWYGPFDRNQSPNL